jgi:hypothetical protein
MIAANAGDTAAFFSRMSGGAAVSSRCAISAKLRPANGRSRLSIS